MLLHVALRCCIRLLLLACIGPWVFVVLYCIIVGHTTVALLPCVMIVRLANTALLRFDAHDAAQGVGLSIVAAIFVRRVWHT